MIWHTTISFFLLRVGGTDSTGDIISSSSIRISSSAQIVDSVTINSSANSGGIAIEAPGLAAPIEVSAGTGGITLTSTLGPVNLFSTNTSSSAIRIDTTASTGTVLLDAGTGGLQFNSAAGTKRMGFFGNTPIVQRVATDGADGTSTPGSVNTVFVDTAWDGYTIGKIVAALKAYGLLEDTQP